MNDSISMFSLEGKTALVTGAASGIGEEIARVFHGAGANVVVADIDQERGRMLAQDLVDRTTFIKLDVTDENSWKSAIALVVEKWGGLNILVNNAGMILSQALTDVSLDDFRRVMAVNLEGVFLGCKHAIPVMARTCSDEQRGSIVNMSSVSGQFGVPMHTTYGASKGAVTVMTKHLALECAQMDLPIRVNTIHPGMTMTPMADSFFARAAQDSGVAEEEVRQQVNALHPLGMCYPRDIAAAALYLASNASRQVTGAEHNVDGGSTQKAG